MESFGSMTEFPKSDSTATAKELRGLVGQLTKRLRVMHPWPSSDYSTGGFFKIPINIQGTPHDMPLGFVGSTGCTWARAGGCTMCDYGGFEGHVSDAQLVEQATRLLNQWPDEKEINLSCLGSFFDDRELSPRARRGIVSQIASRPHIELLGVEARASDVTTAKVREVKQTLGDNRCLEVGMGLESRNDFVRNVCINKGLSTKSFERAVRILRECGCESVGHVLFKPPFLTESEAIADAIDTIEYLSSLDVRRIVLMVCNVKRGTLVGELHRLGLYQAPWLWSVLKTALSVSDGARSRLLIYGFDCGLPMEQLGSNCPKCDEEVLRLIRDFSGSGDADLLEQAFSMQCECKDVWKATLNQTSESPLPVRISQQCAEILGL